MTKTNAQCMASEKRFLYQGSLQKSDVVSFYGAEPDAVRLADTATQYFEAVNVYVPLAKPAPSICKGLCQISHLVNKSALERHVVYILSAQ